MEAALVLLGGAVCLRSFVVFWWFGNITLHHSSMRIAHRALCVYMWPKHSSLERYRHAVSQCIALSSSAREVWWESFSLPNKCRSCGVCICLSFHFVSHYLIAPHAGNVYLFTHQTPAPLRCYLCEPYTSTHTYTPAKENHIVGDTIYVH